MPEFMLWKKKSSKIITNKETNNEENKISSPVVLESFSSKSKSKGLSFQQCLDAIKKDKTIDKKEVSRYENLPEDIVDLHNKSVKLFVAAKSLSDRANAAFGK